MIWIVATVILNSFAQLMLKVSASNDLRGSWWGYISAFAAYGVSVVTWILALRRLPLTVAYPFMGLVFVLVPVVAGLVLQESLSPAQWWFIALLLVALLGFWRSSNPV